MWRNIQGIPRAFRGQLNGCGRTAGSVCKDEENKEAEVSQVQGDKHVTQTYYRSFHNQWQHEYSHQRQWSHDGESKWHKSFNKDFWGTLNQPHSTLEVVGWGSALLLGYHLSQLLRLKGESCKKKYSLKSSPDVVQLALGYPSSYARCCVNDCPPESGQGLTYDEYSFKSEQSELSAESGRNSWVDDTRFSVFELEEVQQNEFDSKLQNDFNTKSNKSNCVKPKRVVFDETTTKSTDDPLPEATAIWNQALSFYESTFHNTKGLNLAKLGHHNNAIEEWEKASYTGFGKANYNLGVCYEQGTGVAIDYAKAAECYTKAASDGHTGATYNLAILYLMGKGNVGKDVNKAIDLLRQAAEQGLVEAQRELGVLYTERNDMQRAASLFDRAAQQLDSASQYYLGICYENGFGVPVNECKAAELYVCATRAGHCEAMYNLAVFYEKGLGGLPEDSGEALSLYRSSMQGGNKSAKDDVERLERMLNLSNESCDDDVFSGLSMNLKKCGSASSPSLIEYLEKHLSEFGLGEWDSKHEPLGLFSQGNGDGKYIHNSKKRDLYNADENNSDVKFLLGSDDLLVNEKPNMGDNGLFYGGFGDAGSGRFTLSLLPGAGRLSRSSSAFELKIP